MHSRALALIFSSLSPLHPRLKFYFYCNFFLSLWNFTHALRFKRRVKSIGKFWFSVLFWKSARVFSGLTVINWYFRFFVELRVSLILINYSYYYKGWLTVVFHQISPLFGLSWLLRHFICFLSMNRVFYLFLAYNEICNIYIIYR